MEKPKRKYRHWIRTIVLVVMVVACLLLPSSKNYASHYYWVNLLFPEVNTIVLLSIRVFLLEAQCWGMLAFVLLGCVDTWMPGLVDKLRQPKRVCLVLRILAVVLLVVLAYLTFSFYMLRVLPPIPTHLGFFLMNNREWMGVLFCLDAVLWQFSMWRKAEA